MSRIETKAVAMTVTLALLACGCVTGKYRDEALRVQSINPHFSLEYAAKALERDPNDQKTVDATRAILGAIAADHRNRIKEMEASGDYEGAVMDCDRILASANFVKSFPGKFNLPYDDGERRELAEKAAEKCYGQGLALEEQKKSRDAYDAYCRCRSFRSNYKDIEQRMRSLEDASTTRLVLFSKVALPDSDDLARSFGTSLGQSTMANRPRFLRFAPDKESATSVCEASINNLVFNDSGWLHDEQKKNEVEVQKKSVTGDTYSCVRRAYWTVNTRKVSCSISAGFSVVPVRAGDPACAGTSTQDAAWEGKYIDWCGDDDALPSDIAKLPRKEVAVPSKDVMVSDCMKKVVADLSSQLFQSYK